MSENGASKLTALCTTLAALGALVGLLFNSGEAPSAASAAAVAPIVAVTG